MIRVLRRYAHFDTRSDDEAIVVVVHVNLGHHSHPKRTPDLLRGLHLLNEIHRVDAVIASIPVPPVCKINECPIRTKFRLFAVRVLPLVQLDTREADDVLWQVFFHQEQEASFIPLAGEQRISECLKNFLKTLVQD